MTEMGLLQAREKLDEAQRCVGLSGVEKRYQTCESVIDVHGQDLGNQASQATSCAVIPHGHAGVVRRASALGQGPEPSSSHLQRGYDLQSS